MAERERETGVQSSGGSKEATAVSWMGQSKCLLGKQAQIVTVHEETWDLRRWLNLISCWLSSFYYIYPVLSPSGLAPWTSLWCFLHLWLSLDLTNESNLPGRGRTESLHLSPHYLWLVLWLCVSVLQPCLFREPPSPRLQISLDSDDTSPFPFPYRAGRCLRLLLVRDNQSFSLLYLLNTPLSFPSL